MAPAEVSGLKNGEPVMAGVLGGDYKDRMADRLLSTSTCIIHHRRYFTTNSSINWTQVLVISKAM